MSGIYISGMEMPTEVCFVNVMLCNDRRVFVYKNGEWEKIGNAIPVHDHGRLIDGDKISKEIKRVLGNHWSSVMIDQAPTVIPPEEVRHE